MKQAVKTLALITISVFLTTASNAQLKVPVINGIAPDVKKVINDYPNQFSNLKGELIVQNPQSIDYECNFKVNGAEQATITQYNSKNNAICSWQALMLTTESFEDAKKKFRSLYGQLNNLTVNTDVSQAGRLNGAFEAPAEEKKFTSVVFAVDNADEGLKKLRVELVMHYELLEWKVKVLVYDKEREDAERGVTVEE